MHCFKLFLFLILVKRKECVVVIENTEWRALSIYTPRLDTVTKEETLPGISLTECGNIATMYIIGLLYRVSIVPYILFYSTEGDGQMQFE